MEKELSYCKELINAIKKNEKICGYPKVQEKLNLLEETVSDNLEHLETSKDRDARTGHKTADTSFFGYKTHIAMTEERIITAATVTSGEKTDGKELPALVRKSRDAGMYQCKAGHLAIHKYLDKRQKEKKIRTREWYTFLMLKNAGAVLTERDVIRRAQKRKPTVRP